MSNHRFIYVTRKMGPNDYDFHKFKLADTESGYARTDDEVFNVKRGNCSCSGFKRKETERHGSGTCKHVEMAKKLEADEGVVMTPEGAKAAVVPLVTAGLGLSLDASKPFDADERGNVRVVNLVHNRKDIVKARLTVQGLKVALRPKLSS